MAFVTYKTFKDTEFVMPKKKAILILVLSIAVDLIYILFRLWDLGVFGIPVSAVTTILGDGQVVTSERVRSDLFCGIINTFLMIGVGLSWIGIFVSAKNLRIQKDTCHSERSEESQTN